MASTTRGIVYPTSGDSIAPLETHFASLAETADTAVSEAEDFITDVNADLQAFKLEVGVIPRVGVSSNFTGPTSTTTPVNVTVNLPPGYFTSIPAVVVSIAASNTASAYFPVLHSITTSQFQVRVWRTTGTAGESLRINWIAK